MHITPVLYKSIQQIKLFLVSFQKKNFISKNGYVMFTFTPWSLLERFM